SNTPASGTPTGSVTFKVDGQTVGTGTLTNGTATFSTSTLPAGTHTVEADYGGATTFAPSSDTKSLTVNKANTTTSLSASATTATVTVRPSGPGIVAVGSDADPNGVALISVYDSRTFAPKYQFQAFDAGFHGGVRVAVATFQGQDVIVAGAGPGGFPLVRL